MKEFIEYIIKNLVDYPDEVCIKEVGGTHTLIIEVSVAKSDIGKIIGKKGKTINALRILVMSVASRTQNLRVSLEILEEDGESGRRSKERQKHRPPEQTVEPAEPAAPSE